MSEKIYDESSIETIEWNKHIRLRPGMYVGKLGDGSSSDDGIYVLLKEVIDNSIDEFMEGHGRTIEVTIKDRLVTVRDYGRGIPLNKMIDCAVPGGFGGSFISRQPRPLCSKAADDVFEVRRSLKSRCWQV